MCFADCERCLGQRVGDVAKPRTLFGMYGLKAEGVWSLGFRGVFPTSRLYKSVQNRV